MVQKKKGGGFFGDVDWKNFVYDSGVNHQEIVEKVQEDLETKGSKGGISKFDADRMFKGYCSQGHRGFSHCHCHYCCHWPCQNYMSGYHGYRHYYP